MKALALIGIIILAIFFLASGGPSVNNDMLQSLRAEAGKCDRMMSAYKSTGLVQRMRQSGDSTTVEVDERRWEQISHDMKVSVGLVAYCINSPNDGKHTVLIRGYRDGASKGSVSNGHWFSS